MTSLLPFTMPDDAYFEQGTMDTFGAARVRGFFPESGVLGVVSLGIATCMALGAGVIISRRWRPGAGATFLAATLIGVTMLGITLTKSGLFMIGGGLAGFLTLLAIGRNHVCRMIAVIGAIAMVAVLLWTWWSFLAPAFRLLKSGTRTATLLAGLYGASAGLSLVFLFTCELYPSYALLLFFKLHADAIAARVQVPWQEIAEEPSEGLLLPAEAST